MSVQFYFKSFIINTCIVIADGYVPSLLFINMVLDSYDVIIVIVIMEHIP